MKFYLAQLDPEKLPQLPVDEQGTLDEIISIAFVTIGALALLMMIIGGLRYIVARGEPTKMAEAKNVIVYSLIGLVIAAMAWAIVNYVLGRV